MKREKLKSGADYEYGQYVFRIPSRRREQFDEVLKNIELLEAHYKETKEEGEKAIRRADIIIESLSLGIKLLLKKEKIG